MASAAAVAQAVAASLDFLLARQDAAGCWSDWDLPPGRSDGWTTAYIGCQLAALPRRWHGRTQAARSAAARWLIEHESPDSGWGYNRVVGPDTDSTAHALLFLSGQGLAVSSAGFARLVGLQRVDGGFPTYPPEAGLGSWGSSQPDVTAVAAHALLAQLGPASQAVVRATRYLRRVQGEDGTWDSFWWSSPLYATAVALSLLRVAPGHRPDLQRTRATLLSMRGQNAFERALLVRCRTLACADDGYDSAAAPVQDLVSAQLADGSWASAPILRLTDRDCADPSAAQTAGPLYADPERLFTTATVLGALGAVERRLAHRKTGRAPPSL